MSEAQKQLGVNRAAPLLENTIIGFRSNTRSRSQVAAVLTAVFVTSDVARYSLDLIRGLGVTTFSFTLCLQIQKSQASKGSILNVRFRRTLRASSQVVMGLGSRNCPTIYASRPVTAYISAAWLSDRTRPRGTRSPWLRLKGFRDRLPLEAARIAAALQGHLFAGGRTSS